MELLFERQYLTTTDLAVMFGMTRSTAIKRLKDLREAGHTPRDVTKHPFTAQYLISVECAKRFAMEAFEVSEEDFERRVVAISNKPRRRGGDRDKNELQVRHSAGTTVGG